MSPKWIILLLLLTVVITLVSGVAEQVYLGENQRGVFMDLVDTNFSFTDYVTLSFITQKLDAVKRMVMFDYAIFKDEAAPFKWILMCFSMGVFFMLFYNLFGRR